MISGVILAAGTSSRLGRPKQLLDLAGKPMLAHAVDAALAAPLDEVVVVLGHAAGEVRGSIGSAGGGRLRFVTNPDYATGQSTSLRAGLRAMAEEVDAAVVLLGDQPGVRPDAIAAVVAAFRRGEGPVVQATYGGRPAHPTLIGRSVWPDLLSELSADEGARGPLSRHPEWRISVEMGGSPPSDVDTEADYARVRDQFEPGIH